MDLRTILLVLTLTLPALALASPGIPAHTAESVIILAQASVISKKQAMGIAGRRVKGRVLSASLIKGDKAPYYKVRVLTQKGRVKTVRIDAGRGAK